MQSGDRLFFCKICRYKCEGARSFHYMSWDFCYTFYKFYMSCAVARGLLIAATSPQAPPLLFCPSGVYQIVAGPALDPPLYMLQPNVRSLYIGSTDLHAL